jgi:multiple sugar transport system ATP-binding protein
VWARPEHLPGGRRRQGTLRHADAATSLRLRRRRRLGELTARVEGTVTVQPGEPVRLGYRPEHLYRFDAAGQRI